MQFDETNGSQVEQLPSVIDETVPTEALKNMSIGEVKPIEVKENSSSLEVTPPSSSQDHQVESDNIEENAEDEGQTRLQTQSGPHHPRIAKLIQDSHPVDNIISDISKGPQTRSRAKLANFCEHYSFVSSFEPTRIDEAIEDED